MDKQLLHKAGVEQKRQKAFRVFYMKYIMILMSVPQIITVSDFLCKEKRENQRIGFPYLQCARQQVIFVKFNRIACLQAHPRNRKAEIVTEHPNFILNL